MKLKRVALTIVGINVAVYLIQMFAGTWFTDMFMLSSAVVLTEPWRLITSMFLHSLANPFHILFNMFVLFFFGPLVEERIGSNRFLGLYLVAGILASIAATFFYPFALGASGAIMGVLGVAVMLMPHMKVLLWGIVPMSLRTLIILFVVFDIFNTFAATNIATMAHFAGLATGIVYGLKLRKRKKTFSKKFEQKFELDDEDMEEYLRSGRI